MKLQVIALAVAIVAVSAWNGDAEAQLLRIEGATGDIAQGAELRITGTGFGVKDPVPPVLAGLTEKRSAPAGSTTTAAATPRGTSGTDMERQW